MPFLSKPCSDGLHTVSSPILLAMHRTINRAINMLPKLYIYIYTHIQLYIYPYIPCFIVLTENISIAMIMWFIYFFEVKSWVEKNIVSMELFTEFKRCFLFSCFHSFTFQNGQMYFFSQMIIIDRLLYMTRKGYVGT